MLTVLLFLFVAFLLSRCYHNVVNKDDYFGISLRMGLRCSGGQRTGAGVRLGADLRRCGGRLEDVGVKEGARRRVVKLGHRVRLVGGRRCQVVVCRRRRRRVMVMMVPGRIRTEPRRRSHAAQVRIVLERVRREDTRSPSAAGGVVQMLVLDVTSGSGLVHGGGVSGRRRSGSGIPAAGAAAFAGSGTASDGQRPRDGGPGRTPTSAVDDRLVLVVCAGKVDGGRGRREGAESGAAGRDPGASERPRVEVDPARRGGSASSARATTEEIAIALDAVQFRTERLTHANQSSLLRLRILRRLQVKLLLTL